MLNSKLKTIIRTNLKDFELSESYGQRSVGDKIEADCRDITKNEFHNNIVLPKSKRSVDDFTLLIDGNKNQFDVKTHFIQSADGFSMPNLISVKRLKKILENENDSLSYIFVDYKRENGIVTIEDIHIKYVWELDWSMLRIGALGKGQLQIKDANKDLVFTNIGKEKWFEILKTKVSEFYKNELKKIQKELNQWQ